MSISAVKLGLHQAEQSILKAPKDAKDDKHVYVTPDQAEDIYTLKKDRLINLLTFTASKTDILNKYEHFSEVLFNKEFEVKNIIIDDKLKKDSKDLIKILLSLNVDVLFIKELVNPLIDGKSLDDPDWINKLIVAITKTMSSKILQDSFDKEPEEIFTTLNQPNTVNINNQSYITPLDETQSNHLYEIIKIKHESYALSVESYYTQLDFDLERNNITVAINNGTITDKVEINKYAYGVWMKKINEILVKTLYHESIMKFSEQDVLSIIFGKQHSKNNIDFNDLSQDLKSFQEQLSNLDDSDSIKSLHNVFVKNIKESNFRPDQINQENEKYIDLIIALTAFMMIKVNCGLEVIPPQGRSFPCLQAIMENMLDSKLLPITSRELINFIEPNNSGIDNWAQKIQLMMPKNKAADDDIPRQPLLELNTKEVVIIEHNNEENQANNLTSTYNINTRTYEIGGEDFSNVKEDARITSVSVLGIEKLAIPYGKMEAIKKIMTEGIKGNQNHKNNIPDYMSILSNKISDLHYMLLQVPAQIRNLSLELPPELATAKCAILEHIATEQLKCLIAYYTEAYENLDKINKYTINNAVMTSKLPDVYSCTQVSHQSDSYIINEKNEIEEIISEKEFKEISHYGSAMHLSGNFDVIISSSLENQKNNSQKVSLYWTPINNKLLTGVRFKAFLNKTDIPLVYSRTRDLSKMTDWESYYYNIYHIDPNRQDQDQDLFGLLKKIINNKYIQDNEEYLQQHRLVMQDCIRIINNKLYQNSSKNELEFYMQLLEKHIIFGQYERRSKDDIYNKFTDKINNKFVIDADIDPDIDKRITELNKFLKYLYHIADAEDNELLLIN